jgi:hypothetical protein
LTLLRDNNITALLWCCDIAICLKQARASQMLCVATSTPAACQALTTMTGCPVSSCRCLVTEPSLSSSICIGTIGSRQTGSVGWPYSNCKCSVLCGAATAVLQALAACSSTSNLPRSWKLVSRRTRRQCLLLIPLCTETAHKQQQACAEHKELQTSTQPLQLQLYLP